MAGEIYQSPFDQTVPSYGDSGVPYDYGVSMESTAPGIVDIVNSNKVAGEDWTTTLQRVMSAVAATYQQKQILSIQADRARQGLPPLDASAYGMGVNVGLSPATLNTLLMIGGGIALAVLLAAKRSRPNRRKG